MKKGIDYPGITIVYFCHDGNCNFIMAKRSNQCRDEHGCWDIGAGGLELGDTIEKTLSKEINEEYCTDVIEFEPLGYREMHREHKGNKTHWVALDFKVLVNRDKVKNGEPHKFDAVEWFNFDNMPNPTHSQFPIFLKKYGDKLKVA